jgi:hypothetical protein
MLRVPGFRCSNHLAANKFQSASTVRFDTRQIPGFPHESPDSIALAELDPVLRMPGFVDVVERHQFSESGLEGASLATAAIRESIRHKMAARMPGRWERRAKRSLAANALSQLK